MGLIYPDSCILMYALEDQGPRGDRARARLRETDEELVTSPLVLHECLVKPLRENDAEMRKRFSDVYDRMTHIQMDTAVFIAAAEVRARFALKAPDSLHLAAAQLSGADQLWTNDKRMAAASHGLAVDIIGDALF